MWSPDLYMETMYKEKVKKHACLYDSHWQRDLKTQLQQALGRFPSFPEEMKPVVFEVCDELEYKRFRLEITTYPSLTMPLYLLIPKQVKGKVPVVLALHGHGYGSKEIVGLHPDGSENRGDPGIHKNFAVELVKNGVMVASPELIGFGDRRMKKDQSAGAGANSCFSLASKLLMMGKTLPGLRINECRRLLDYLITRDDVDSDRIGCMGLSGGGLVGAYTSVLDQRIKAAVISGYTNTFKGSIMDRNHCLDNYIPDILNYAEMAELIGLMAPRPIFIEAGQKDKVFPIEDAKTASRHIKEIYASFQAEREVETHFFTGGHEISGEKSIAWLVNKLTD